MRVMPSRLPEHAVVALLRQCYLVPRCQAARTSRIGQIAISRKADHTCPSKPCPSRQLARRQQTSSFHNNSRNSAAPSPRASGDTQSQNEGGKRIAVVGGGITGLTAAHFLAKEIPTAKITIYEAGNRLGGWLQSEYVDVPDGSKILFEAGPRTLRPGTPPSLATAQLIEDLDLVEEVIINPKGSVAAQNRFVYYPDHLVRMPGPGQSIFDNLWTIISEPAFKDWWQMILEPIRDAGNLSGDETIASFLHRRLGTEEIGNNLASAVIHGIYAGDINKLSARCIFGALVAMERGSAGSIIGGMAEGKTKPLMPRSDAELMRELQFNIDDSPLHFKLAQASVYSFKEGIGALSKALDKRLRANPNVTFKSGSPVTGISYENGGIEIKTKNTPVPALYQYAISTVPAKSLSTLTTPALPTLSNIHSVTVMVVNLYFTDPTILPEHGFGYLIPQTVPLAQNPERALGVVFDSDALQGQDHMAPGVQPGTKVTVMLGGHWWDDFNGAYPSDEEGEFMARSVLARHLKITDEPEKVKVTLQRECIPQYYATHIDNLGPASQVLQNAFKGKLKVAGSSYSGVSIHDCVKSGRAMAMAVKEGDDVKVGMEAFLSEPWVTVESKKVG